MHPIESPRAFQRLFVQHLDCFFKLALLLAKRVVLFIQSLVADHSMQTVCVVPVNPFHGFRFELAYGFSRAEVFDDLRLAQSDDSFGQGIVEAVFDASDRTVASGSAPFPLTLALAAGGFRGGLRGSLGTFQKRFLTDLFLWNKIRTWRWFPKKSRKR